MINAHLFISWQKKQKNKKTNIIDCSKKKYTNSSQYQIEDKVHHPIFATHVPPVYILEQHRQSMDGGMETKAGK